MISLSKKGRSLEYREDEEELSLYGKTGKKRSYRANLKYHWRIPGKLEKIFQERSRGKIIEGLEKLGCIRITH